MEDYRIQETRRLAAILAQETGESQETIVDAAFVITRKMPHGVNVEACQVLADAIVDGECRAALIRAVESVKERKSHA